MIAIVIPHTGPLYHGSLTMAGARLIASVGLTDRGLLSGQLLPVDDRFKLTTMKTTLVFVLAVPALLLRTCTTALFTHNPTPIVYISYGANRSTEMHIFCGLDLITRTTTDTQNNNLKIKLNHQC